MTHEQREAIRAAIHRWTENAVSSPEAARKALTATGIYDAYGELKPEHGGPPAFGSREWFIRREAEFVAEKRQEPPLPHEPLAWKRRHGSETSWTWFGRYSAKSMAKWVALRGHAYDVLLANGQLVTVKPRSRIAA